MMSWWLRRPKGTIGAPPSRDEPWSTGLVIALGLMAVVLPIFGLSVVVVGAVGWMIRRRSLPHAA